MTKNEKTIKKLRYQIANLQKDLQVKCKKLRDLEDKLKPKE